MSIFKSILAKIFPSEHPANQATPQANAGSATPPAAGTSSGATAPTSTTPRSPETATGTPGVTSSMAAPTATNATSQASTAQPVDVEAILREMQSKNSEKLNWQTSIVDLLKLLGLDSSLTARKQLAKELNYTGSTDDSATMNIWLHKEVMRRFAQSGGKVPEELRG
ncbi:DUF3597 domain-containing protein [Candidimonas sp. SYP-B2681]|uniref:DUF3597 domain-containing protein n=1 Tax=Candidimonas sp. SYP-B2681 TaxID=2497686 RepID=UPI000F873E74|nr:DUF3597 domain-containing protein [Candidimonas sp. SYP-B2681]RTZ41089.1 DUF3597 domain-containing protein [Candidimonas sp. SYP-B2681]